MIKRKGDKEGEKEGGKYMVIKRGRENNWR